MRGIWAECPFKSMPVSRYIVGLTGGIGSGKSTTADIFATLGVALIDTDAIAHALTVRGGRAMTTIRAHMGTQFIGKDGELDRAVTRDRVFTDASIKRQLEAILHPLIQEEVEAGLCSKQAIKAPYAMLVVPLLFETLTYRNQTHTTLLIDCPIDIQLKRVKRRAGLDEGMAVRIVDAQLPRPIRLQLADDVIWNGDSADALGSQVQSLHIRYAQNARNLR